MLARGALQVIDGQGVDDAGEPVEVVQPVPEALDEQQEVGDFDLFVGAYQASILAISN